MTQTTRQCDECTACCEGWLWARINNTDVYVDHPCPHLSESRCNIYAERPFNPCIKYMCAWIQTNTFYPDWMRPDKCGAIVNCNKLSWQGLPVDVALPLGEKIPQKTLDWLIEFSGQQRRPLIFITQLKENGKFINKQSMTGVGPPAFQQQLAEWVKSGTKII